MTNRQRPPSVPARPQTRRQVTAQRHEANIQRRVLLIIGGLIALTLLLIVGGIVYERVWRPSQNVRSVNGASLTQGGYEALTRQNLVQQMAQTLYYSILVGSNQSFGQGGTFAEQIIESNAQLAAQTNIRNRDQPVDEAVVSAWVDKQIVEQGAAADFNIDPSQGEVDQAIVAQFAGALDTQPLTDTDTVTPTASVEAELASAQASAQAAAEASPDASASASAEPTATPQPTATPGPEQATQLVAQIVERLYTEYDNIMGSLPEEATDQQKRRNLTQDELAATLRNQFREQLIQQRVKEALVPELPADDSSEPDQISTRHILLKVPAPTPTPEAAPDETATAEPAASAEASAAPEPTPTLAPEALDALFAERKAEADALYQELIANPERFADIARERSEDEGSAANGGDLPSFNREGVSAEGSSFVQPYVEAAWALQPNEISQPVRSEFGWHIIQRVPEDPATRLERLRTAAYDTWLAEKRSQATIVPPPSPTPTLPPEAQTEVPPLEETAEPSN